MLSLFPRDVLDEILNLIESVSEGFPSYSYTKRCAYHPNSPRVDKQCTKCKKRLYIKHCCEIHKYVKVEELQFAIISTVQSGPALFADTSSH